MSCWCLWGEVAPKDWSAAVGPMNALSYAQGSDANKPVSVWLAVLGFLVLYCTFTELTLAANKVGCPLPRAELMLCWVRPPAVV